MANEQLKEQIKLQRQQNKIAKESAQFAERSRESSDEYFKTKKKIADISEKLRELDLDILEAALDTTEEGKENLAILKEEKKLREGILIESRKQLSLVKTLANVAGKKVLGALNAQSQVLRDSVSMYFDIDKAVRKTSMSLGLSGSRMDALSQKTANVANNFASMGLDSTDAIEAQATYNEEVGRTVMLSEQSMNNMGRLGNVTGLGVQAISQMSAQMEGFGMGAGSAMQSIENISDTAQGMGINTGKVLKKVGSSMGLLNKLNFKGGVKGLGKMAAYSEKFKMNMEDIASSAKAVWSPEGAIEAAASLEMLGGGFSKLADPFKLMFDARNDPQKYAEGIIDSLDGIAKFKDGQFGVSAYEMQRLDEAGKALGFSGEKMKEMAIAKAKMDKAGGALSMFTDPKEKEMLESMLTFNEKGNALLEGKALSEMKKSDIENMLKQEKLSEKQAEDAITTRKMFESLSNQVMSTFLPIMKDLDEWLRPAMKTLSGWVKQFPEITAGLVVAGAVIGKAAEWYIKGVRLGLGFNSAVKKGGFFTRMKNLMSGSKGKQSAVTNAFQPRSVGMDKVKGGNPLGKQSGLMKKGGMNPGSMIKGAAAIVILSAALWVFAKAMQELDQVTNKGEVILMAVAGLGMMAAVAKVMAKGSADMIMGAAAIAILGASLIPFAFAMQMMGSTTNGFTSLLLLAGGLSMLAIVAGLMGAASPAIILGAVAIGILSLALIPLGYAIKLVSEGISMIIDSFTNMFSVINADNIGPLLLLGPALMGVSLGVAMLGGSLLMLAATMAMGGWIGLMALGVAAESVGEAFNGIDADGITKSVSAINNVNMDKINALKELSVAMSKISVSSKPIQVELKASGQIGLGDGSETGTDFDVSKLTQSQIDDLKNLIFQSQKVGITGGL
jgi:hypothetical protein